MAALALISSCSIAGGVSLVAASSRSAHGGSGVAAGWRIGGGVALWRYSLRPANGAARRGNAAA